MSLWDQYLVVLVAAGGKLKRLPWWLGSGGITIGRYVFLDQRIWGTDRGAREVSHETVHVVAVRREGFRRFYSRWVFSRHWRLIYEGAAYRESVAFERRHRPDQVFGTQAFAVRCLMGWPTWWAAPSAEIARAAIAP